MHRLRTEVIDTGLCIGCGVCVGICATGVGAMSLGTQGLHVPRFDEHACTSCGRCETVCPFLDSAAEHASFADELFSASGAKRNEAIGWVERSFAFAAEDDRVRAAGSSGGFVTWLLSEALRAGEITGAWCVFGDGVSRPTEYRLARTVDDLLDGAGSKYAPAHLAAVIEQTRRLGPEERVAVVALPCHAAALRSAMALSQKLADRVALVVGLVCGQGKTALYPRALAAPYLASGDVIERVRYRVKGGRSARDYETQLEVRRGAAVRTLGIGGQELGRAWERRLASPYACCFCTDLFASCADVACMDAWLSPYSSDPRGTSLVVVRDSRRSGVLRSLVQSEALEDVSPHRVAASQAGALTDKSTGESLREELAVRLRLPYVARCSLPGPAMGRAQRLRSAAAFLGAASVRLGEATPRRRALGVAATVTRLFGDALAGVAAMVRRDSTPAPNAERAAVGEGQGTR